MRGKITGVFSSRKHNQVGVFWSRLLYLFISNWLIYYYYSITCYICNIFHLQMTPRGRGGDRTPPNRGDRGVHVYCSQH